MMSKNRRIMLVIAGIFIVCGGYYMFKSHYALIGILPILIGATGFCPACYFLNRCSLKR